MIMTMMTFRVTDKNKLEATITEFQAVDQSQAEIIGKEYASGTIYGLWIRQTNGDWLEL